MKKVEQQFLGALQKILTPVVRMALRLGISCDVFNDIVKLSFVRLAEKEYAIPGRKQSHSRISIVTGLTRKEIQRMQSFQLEEDLELIRKMNRCKRVIAGWMNDEFFHDDQGQPALLPIESEDGAASFAELVKRYSGDMPLRALQDEMTRVGAIEIQNDWKVRLITRGYVPAKGEIEKLRYLGEDVGALVNSIDKNIYSDEKKQCYHKRVNYENLSEEDLIEIEKIISQEAQRCLEKVDKKLEHHDQPKKDKNKNKNRAGLVLYYYEEDES